MNLTILSGRATKLPEIRYVGEKQTCMATINIAVDKWDGKQRSADFFNVTCFGKTAEHVEKYVSKGMMLGIVGQTHNNNYEKDGKKVYTNQIVADRVEFLSKSEKTEEERASQPPKGFSHLEDDISFEDTIPF